MAMRAKTEGGCRRISGVGYLGHPAAVQQKLEDLVPRLGGVRQQQSESGGLRPVIGTGRRSAAGDRAKSGRRAGFSGFFLTPVADGWTLCLLARTGGRLRTVRSVQLGTRVPGNREEERFGRGCGRSETG